MPAAISQPTLRKLETAARKAAAKAYAPYSKFRVGAAVLTGSGKIFTGCNVENASYGLTNCAERIAVFTAVSHGERRVSACVVYTPTPEPMMPCGACRQVIHEFGPHANVLSVCDSYERIETTLDRLQPAAFGPKALGKKTPRARR